MKYLNGQLTPERSDTPFEEKTPDEREFDAVSFGGTYSTRHDPVKQAGSRSVVIPAKPWIRPVKCADCGILPLEQNACCAECRLPLCSRCACPYDTQPMCSECSLVEVKARRRRVSALKGAA